MENKIVTTQDLINQFRDEYQMRLSPGTLAIYKYYIETFFKDYGKEYNEVKARDIRDWVHTLYIEGKSPSTIEGRMYGLRQFFKFCVEDGYLEKNPNANISIPGVEDRLPIYLEKGELVRLKELVKDNVRDSALIYVMYSTGARASEVANMKIKDVNLEGRYILIRKGKGNKDRIVPFTIECGERIKAYLSQRTDNISNLFLNNINTPIQALIIQRYFIKYSNELGMKIQPRNLRSTLAVHLALRGMPLHCIQEILGHCNIKTTMIYTRLYNHARKQQYDDFL